MTELVLNVKRTLPAGRRLERCRYCNDMGWVEIEQDDPHDEEWLRRVRHMTFRERLAAGLNRPVYTARVAPCPKCEQGKANEFPADGKDGTPGYVLSPWGKDGYWQGRDHSWLRPMPDERPVSRDEGRRQLAELGLRLGVGAHDEDPIRSQIRQLRNAGRGECHDCLEPNIDRLRFGLVSLCGACAASRLRARATPTVRTWSGT